MNTGDIRAVYENGILRPLEPLGDIAESQEVRVIILPVHSELKQEDGPAGSSQYKLGSDPVTLDVNDASVNHDEYLYDA